MGGGAAGLATAIFTARQMPERSILVLDGAAKLGAKILVSGGGRCNVTNVVVTGTEFFGGSPNVIKRVLSALPVSRTVAFFEEIGVHLHEEVRGKLFPDSNKAQSVLSALLAEAARLGIRFLVKHRVTAIVARDSGFEVTAGGTTFRAGKVVLATGGQSLPKTGSDGFGYRLAQSLGHSLVPPTPALAPLILEGEFHVPLSGISQDVELTVRVEGTKPIRHCGSLLWTHFGVSGPVVLDVSRHWHRARLDNRTVEISASFLPGDDFTAAESRLVALASEQPRAQLHNALASIVPARVADALLSALGISPKITLANLPKDVRRKLTHALLEWPLPVRDSRGYTYAEVTAGGVPLSEVDPATLASRKCPGLYLVGEILDVDGRIGGFNFQWAWSSAYVAATAMARDLDKQ